MTPRNADAPAGDRGDAAGYVVDGIHNPIVPHPPVEYRTPPEFLTTASIVSELMRHIGDAETWPGPIGAYARQRAAGLRDELNRRGAS